MLRAPSCSGSRPSNKRHGAERGRTPQARWGVGGCFPATTRPGGWRWSAGGHLPATPPTTQTRWGGSAVGGGTYMLPPPTPHPGVCWGHLPATFTHQARRVVAGEGGVSAIEESRSFGNKSETCFWSKIEMFSSIDTKQR